MANMMQLRSVYMPLIFYDENLFLFSLFFFFFVNSTETSPSFSKYLLTIVDAHSHKEKLSGSIQSSDGGWCTLHHLLGCCLLAQAQGGLNGIQKEKKICEAVRCFFRYLVFCKLVYNFIFPTRKLFL